MTLRSAYRWLAPAGAKSRLTILIFHRVHPRPDPLFPGEPDARELESRMRWVKCWFNVLPLGEAVVRLGEGRLPERPLAITFDDGYADNAAVAAPILLRLGIPATFFVATGFLDGGRMWNDTVIEAIRAAAGPVLDLAPLGLGEHAIADDEARRAAIDRLIRALKYLPLEQRAEKANRIAEIARAALPHDLDDARAGRAPAARGWHDDRRPHGESPDPEQDSRGGGAVRDRARPEAARGHHRRSRPALRLSERQAGGGLRSAATSGSCASSASTAP